MKKAAALLLLLLLAATGLVAQEAQVEASSPFVSRLKAQAGQNSIVLTWRTSADAAGSCRVYRHSEEIDARNFPAATQIATVAAGVAAFEDLPSQREDYFYAVLLEDGKGGVHQVFIPFRNKTSAPVRIASLAPEESLAARIEALSAAVAGDAVRLRFLASRGDRELLLFRSTGPMRTAEDLLTAGVPIPLATGTRTYSDYPIPGIDYYYAVADAGLFKIGKPELVAGQNSTVVPVQVPVGSGRVGLPPAAAVSSEPPASAATATAAAASPAAASPAAAPPRADRSAPLPFLSLTSGVATGNELPPAPVGLPRQSDRPLKAETRQALRALLGDAPTLQPPAMEPQALAADQEAGVESEAYGLGVILAEQLLPRDLEGAVSRLSAFLSVRRSAEATARAHFYLGQAYYLQGRYEKSFLELLLARDRYYTAVEPWLAASLLALPALRGR
jgi:hypothetical protein